MNDADPFLVLDLDLEHFGKMTFSTLKMTKSGVLGVHCLNSFHRAKCMGVPHHLQNTQKQTNIYIKTNKINH